MKKLRLILLLSFVSNFIQAQNLLPNHSFEEKIECPYHSFGSMFTLDWITANPNPFTYFNSCDSTNVFGVPVNASGYGYQLSYDGNAYIAITTYGYSQGSSNHKDYAQVKLKEPLVAGKEYYWCFRVSLFDNSVFISNNMGLALSSQLINSTNYDIIITPFYNHNDMISEADTWVELSGSYTAIGGEEYLIIGNFHPMNSTNIASNSLHQFIGFDGSYEATYYVDDIYLGDKNKCSNAEPEISNVFTPNGDGNNDLFLLDFPFIKATIYNRWGQKIFEVENNGGSWDGRTTSGTIVSNGTYFYIIETEVNTYKGYVELLR